MGCHTSRTRLRQDGLPMSVAVDIEIKPSAGASVRRFAGLDGLRAVAAIGIFVHHAGFWSGATFSGYWGRYIGRLDIGVPIFFTLSGFLLFRPIVVSILDDRPLRPAIVHLWRRAMRIYPAFWVVLALIVVFTSEHFNDTSGTVVTFLLVQIHWPTHVLGPMPQAWSLATEVSFYAMLPLLARVLRPLLADRQRSGRRDGLLLWIGAGYLFSLAFRSALSGLANRWTGAANVWLPAMFDYFAIGMAIAVLHVAFPAGSAGRSRLDRLGRRAWVWWLGAALAFHVVSQQMGLALGVETAWWPREVARQFVYGLISFMLLFPVVFGTGHQSRVRRFLSSRTMEWLGTISYSIYMWHLVFIVHAWQPLNGRVDWFWDHTIKAAWFHSAIGWSGVDALLAHRFFPLLIVAGVPTLVMSAITYYAVERTGLHLQGRVRRPFVDPTPLESRVSAAIHKFEMISFRAQIALVAAAGMLLRIGYVVTKRHQGLGNGKIFPGDQFYYSLAGDALAAGKGFVVPWQDRAINAGLAAAGTSAPPAADHPPLTAIVSTPASMLPGNNLIEQRLTMALVGTVAIVVVGLLARELAGRRVGIIGAGLAAIYPGFWINDGLVMAESLATLLVAGTLWAAFRYRRLPGLVVGVELGIWIGLGALARAESLLLIPLIVFPLVWVSHSGFTRLTRVVAITAVSGLILAPWVIPNLIRFNDPVVMSTNDGSTLIGANSPQTFSGPAIGFWSLEFSQGIDVAGLDQSEVAGTYRRAAVDYVGDHLSNVPAVAAARVGRVWSVFRPLQMADFNQGEGRELWASYLALLGFYLAIPFAVLGWRRLDSDIWRWPLVAVAVQVNLIAVAFYGIPRFRVVAEVALVVLAAVGLSRVLNLGSRALSGEVDVTP